MEDPTTKVPSRFGVRDLRKKGWYHIDNDYIDKGYVRLLGAHAFVIYNALCRHAELKSQNTYVGMRKLEDRLGISHPTVVDCIAALEIFNIITKIRIGKMCTNRYYLIDKTHWANIEDREVLLTLLTSLKTSEVNSTYFTGLLKRLHKATEATSNSIDTRRKETQSKEGKKKLKTKAQKIREKIQDTKNANKKGMENKLAEIREDLERLAQQKSEE